MTNKKIHRLISNNSQIGFFDVSNLHSTYIKNPFFKSKLISKLLNKIHNSLLVRIYNKIKAWKQ